MTGQQPHPETGENARGITKKIAIEDVVKSIQVDWVKTVSAYNLTELKKALKEGYEKKGVCVLITEGPCRLGKRLKGGTLKSPVVER